MIDGVKAAFSKDVAEFPEFIKRGMLMSLEHEMDNLEKRERDEWHKDDQMQNCMNMGHMNGGMGMYGPQLFKEAVCCMDGMKCWDSSYSNMQGRANLEDELKMLENEFLGVRDHFDELNAENVEKEKQRKKEEFANAKTQARQLANKVKDMNLRKEKLQAARGSMSAEEQKTADAQLGTWETELQHMMEERDRFNEDFARFNEQDARDQADHLRTEMEDLKNQMQQRKAEAEWEAKQVAAWDADMNDTNKPEAVRDQAKIELTHA